MTDFTRREDLRLDTAFSAISGGISLVWTRRNFCGGSKIYKPNERTTA